MSYNDLKEKLLDLERPPIGGSYFFEEQLYLKKKDDTLQSLDHSPIKIKFNSDSKSFDLPIKENYLLEIIENYGVSENEHNVWEIPIESFEIDKWEDTEILKNIDQLGIADDSDIRLELVKFYILGQDCDYVPKIKDDKYFATAYLSMSSIQHIGGNLTLGHGDEAFIVNFKSEEREMFDVNCVIYFNDVNVKMETISQGYRICLLYGISNSKSLKPSASLLYPIEKVEKAVNLLASTFYSNDAKGHLDKQQITAPPYLLYIRDEYDDDEKTFRYWIQRAKKHFKVFVFKCIVSVEKHITITNHYNNTYEESFYVHARNLRWRQYQLERGGVEIDNDLMFPLKAHEFESDQEIVLNDITRKINYVDKEGLIIFPKVSSQKVLSDESLSTYIQQRIKKRQNRGKSIYDDVTVDLVCSMKGVFKGFEQYIKSLPIDRKTQFYHNSFPTSLTQFLSPTGTSIAKFIQEQSASGCLKYVTKENILQKLSIIQPLSIADIRALLDQRQDYPELFDIPIQKWCLNLIMSQPKGFLGLKIEEFKTVIIPLSDDQNHFAKILLDHYRTEISSSTPNVYSIVKYSEIVKLLEESIVGDFLKETYTTFNIEALGVGISSDRLLIYWIVHMFFPPSYQALLVEKLVQFVKPKQLAELLELVYNTLGLSQNIPYNFNMDAYKELCRYTSEQMNQELQHMKVTSYSLTIQVPNCMKKKKCILCDEVNKFIADPYQRTFSQKGEKRSHVDSVIQSLKGSAIETSTGAKYLITFKKSNSHGDTIYKDQYDIFKHRINFLDQLSKVLF
ncbi:hypothetical protein DLAC_00473 [Tieghemostelium lacteum]|uniref:Uncharacterized protein n=1 Tax=Tieghemostelium lacteum TaxID=361077 RepID=A0A152AA90_TIELA|nr:hypothetical protein DLAC_00473 [Tieghemostelium lacteum]|eukprot:KYR02987.1 hypothetical protein DLAC_00473 [Tieghemostelium lacteum]